MSPTSDHPSTEQLLEYLRVQDRPEDAERVSEHVEQRCLRCIREIHALMPRSHKPPEGEPALFEGTEEQKRQTYRRIAHRVNRLAAVLRVEAELVPELFAQLLGHTPEARRSALREGTSFRFLALAEHLVERSREAVFEDPAQATELAELAVEAAEALSREVYPLLLVLDAQILAWAALGNARRVRSDLVGADRCLGTALQLLEKAGPVRSSTRGEVLSLLGSLRIDQARFRSARQVLEEAVEVFRQNDDRRREAKALLKLAQALGEAGEAEAAISSLEQTRALLGEEDGQLRLITGHYLAQALNDAGRAEEATELYERLESEYATHGREFGIDQRRRWLAARLARARGDAPQAEALLEGVRDGFLEREIGYDYALASLELAELLVEQGRAAEVRRLAEEMVPLFASRQLHGHALAALAMFQQAAAAQEATSALVRDVAGYLRRARNNPQLRYAGEGGR